MKGLIEKNMDEREREKLLLGYYSRLDQKKRNPVALTVRSEDMRRWLLGIPKDDVLCLDLETTGLDPHDNDEVLQVSICDGNGKMLLNSYVHPVHRRRWTNAEAIHGITPEMVKDAPALLDLNDEIHRLLSECTLLIGYNIRNFDLEFLKAGGIDLPRVMTVYDLINDCSVLYSTWNDYYGNYTYISLENMTKKLRVTYSPHDSSEDVKATVKVFYKLLNGTKMQNAIKNQKTTEQVLKDADKTLEKIEKTRAMLHGQQTPSTRATYQRKPVGCIGMMVIVISVSILFVLIAAALT